MIKCVICGLTVDSIDEAINQGWIPYFYDGDKEHEQACSSCSKSLLQLDEDGEMVVKEEYRDKISYKGEQQKVDWMMEIILSPTEENIH